MAELVSTEKINDLVKKLVADEVQNYFRMSRPGFEIASGHKTNGHDVGEFCMTTDTAQGIHFYQDGQCKISSQKSIEIRSGKKSGEDDFSIVIETSHGDVKITAKQNDVVIQGNRIMIHASELLQLRSATKIDIGAPSVDITGDDINAIGIDTLRLLGGSTELFADNSLDISEGVDLLLNTDIVSRLTNLADDIKKLLIFSI
ncbi:MAG: hypothetical protein CM15mV20_3060 [uncultured marine virus]|nr:MAG: hypothetical protein CM15mV20_3060 [uncultured marine virus]